MSANRYTHLQSRPYLSTHVPLPLDLMYRGLAMKQKTQDEKEAERIDLLGKQVNALEQDVPLVKERKAEIDKTLEYFADKDFTDPSVKAEWARKRNEVSNEYGPQGTIGAIEANYTAFNK